MEKLIYIYICNFKKLFKKIIPIIKILLLWLKFKEMTIRNSCSSNFFFFPDVAGEFDAQVQ